MFGGRHANHVQQRVRAKKRFVRGRVGSVTYFKHGGGHAQFTAKKSVV